MGLIFGWGYTWRGLFSEFYGITSFSKRANFKHAHPIFSGIFHVFLSGWVYMCVCGGAGREKESTGYKQTFKGRLETRKACVCCVLEISGFETTTIQTCTSLSWTLCCRFLDQKASLMTKSRYHEYGKETRANLRSFSRQLTLETELVVSSAMMVFWMALLARGRVIFVPGAPAICWVDNYIFVFCS